MKAPRILLVDDHAMFLSGLSLVIASAIPSAQVLQAICVADALAIPGDPPDLVLLDVQLPGESGLDGIGRIHKRWPAVPVLMLSALDDADTPRHARARGAAGYVSKAQTALQIVEAVQAILGGSYFYGSLTPAVPVRSEGAGVLTPRQREVLQFLHQGHSNKLIARHLNLSDNTVRRHVQDILETLNVTSRMEAVAAARTQFLVQ